MSEDPNAAPSTEPASAPAPSEAPAAAPNYTPGARPPNSIEWEGKSADPDGIERRDSSD